MDAQERWLNKMASKGYQLVHTDKMLYEFDECKQDGMQYRVEFVGEKSKNNAQDYKGFLEELGYTVFYKNINLNYSIGKVRYRPWAEAGGRIATNGTTFNRELLIVGKKNDGKPFELHSTFEDKVNYYQIIRKPWLFIALLCMFLSIAEKSAVFLGMALLCLIPVVFYQRSIIINKQKAKTEEQ